MKMKKKIKTSAFFAIGLLAAFVFWTLLVRFVDVSPIGPQGSSVGVATLNEAVHRMTGVHVTLYELTDWFGLIPIFVALGFGVLGLVQWIQRKSIAKVDRSILALGMFYVVVVALFLLFEKVVINYRPVLIDGVLEASYPSSTTLLVTCVIPTAMMQFRRRIKHTFLRRGVLIACGLFLAGMVFGRLISGVHWVTDIVGGLLLSAGLVTAYSVWGDGK